MIEYKFDEDRLLDELKTYIDTTYNAHYSQSKFQATEFIFDMGHVQGLGCCLGNVLKYAQRYGRKEGYNRKDLMKVLHYTIMALYLHDTEKDELNNGS